MHNPDSVWKFLLCQSWEKPYQARLCNLCLKAVANTPPKKRLVASFLPRMLYSVNEHKVQKWCALECHPFLCPTYCNHTSSVNTCPNGDLILNTTLSFFPPDLCYTKGNGATQFPYALCAMVICSVFWYLETHSKYVFLCEVGLFAKKISSFHKQVKAAQREVWLSSPCINLTISTQQEAGCFLL